MSIQVSFRVVGVYCYFENLKLPNTEPSATVQEVMDEIVKLEPGFSYVPATVNSKLIVDSMAYRFGDTSTTPYNTSKRPDNGFRDLTNNVSSDPFLVWQYYRSVTVSINDKPCEIKLLQRGQPSFAKTSLNFYDSFFGSLPPEETFKVLTYNLTWRMVQIQIRDENRAAFMQGQAALKK